MESGKRSWKTHQLGVSYVSWGKKEKFQPLFPSPAHPYRTGRQSGRLRLELQFSPPKKIEKKHIIVIFWQWLTQQVAILCSHGVPRRGLQGGSVTMKSLKMREISNWKAENYFCCTPVLWLLLRTAPRPAPWAPMPRRPPPPAPRGEPPCQGGGSAL